MIESFFTTDAGMAAVFSAVATIAAVLVAQWLRGRVRLITFSPNSTFFNLKSEGAEQPVFAVRSGQVMIQNLGRKAAKNVQVVASGGTAPAGYTVVPPIAHSAGMDGHGQWVMEISFVAPKEVITLQILNGPNIDSVRCDEGFAKVVPVMHQRQFPTWVNASFLGLMTWGLLSLFYVIGRSLLSW